MEVITTDVETVPEGEYEQPSCLLGERPMLDDIAPHKTMKDPDKQIAFREKGLIAAQEKYDKKFDDTMSKDENWYKKRSLNDKKNQVISISIKHNDTPVACFAGANEKENLIGLLCWMDDLGINTLKDVLWVGHSIIRFDFPVLQSKIRAQYRFWEEPYRGLAKKYLESPFFMPTSPRHAYEPTYITWKKPELQERPLVYDLYHHLPGTDSRYMEDGKERTGKSLDAILKHYGYVGKTGVDGSMVLDLWNQGDLGTIVDYNKDEVQQMYELFIAQPLWWK